MTHAHTQIYSSFPKFATQFKISVLALTVLFARNSKLPPLLTNFPLFSYDASQPEKSWKMYSSRLTLWFFLQLYLTKEISLVMLLHDMHLSSMEPCWMFCSHLPSPHYYELLKKQELSLPHFVIPRIWYNTNCSINVCLIEMKSGWMFQNNIQEYNSQRQYWLYVGMRLLLNGQFHSSYLFLCLLSKEVFEMCSRTKDSPLTMPAKPWPCPDSCTRCWAQRGKGQGLIILKD